jgi:phage-related protein
MPSDWRPMSAVGGGVIEIRIHGRLEHRVLYIGKFQEAIYVLHAFEKKSHRTRKADLDLARSRLKEVEASRRIRREN